MPYLPKSRRILIYGAVAALSGAVAAPALAHHSYSMFDKDKTITINGTIRTWELTNPHSYLWVNVVKDDGVVQAWGLEGGGVQALTRAGVTKSAISPGLKVSVTLHPLRDGRTGGQLMRLTLPDGRIIGQGGGAAGAAGAAPAAGLD